MKLLGNPKFVAAIFLTVIGTECSFADTTLGKLADEVYQRDFLKDKFSDSVLGSIAAKDNNDLPFKKITYNQTTHLIGVVSNFSRDIQGDVTVIAQGGPFVTIISQDDLTGTEATINFEFGYRGIMVLRDQKYFPNQPVSVRRGQVPKPFTDIIETKNIFTVSSPEAQKTNSILNFSFDAGTKSQIFGYKKLKRVCSSVEEFSASKIDASLTGDAVTLKCILSDEANNPLNGYEEKIYFKDYGVALKSKIETPQIKVLFDIKDVHVEK